MKKYIANAFSLQMVEAGSTISTKAVLPEEIPEDVISVVGHADTARVISGILGRDIPTNRVSIKIEKGDELYVAQIQGGRLPEGATTLPEGVTITFVKVMVVE